MKKRKAQRRPLWSDPREKDPEWVLHAPQQMNYFQQLRSDDFQAAHHLCHLQQDGYANSRRGGDDCMWAPLLHSQSQDSHSMTGALRHSGIVGEQRGDDEPLQHSHKGHTELDQESRLLLMLRSLEMWKRTRAWDQMSSVCRPDSTRKTLC